MNNSAASPLSVGNPQLLRFRQSCGTDLFSAEFLGREASGVGGPVRPVSILRKTRFGTSLVEQIPAGHPVVFGGEELKCLAHLVSKQPDSAADLSRFQAVVENYDERLAPLAEALWAAGRRPSEP